MSEHRLLSAIQMSVRGSRSFTHLARAISKQWMGLRSSTSSRSSALKSTSTATARADSTLSCIRQRHYKRSNECLDRDLSTSDLLSASTRDIAVTGVTVVAGCPCHTPAMTTKLNRDGDTIRVEYFTRW